MGSQNHTQAAASISWRPAEKCQRVDQEAWEQTLRTRTRCWTVTVRASRQFKDLCGLSLCLFAAQPHVSIWQEPPRFTYPHLDGHRHTDTCCEFPFPCQRNAWPEQGSQRMYVLLLDASQAPQLGRASSGIALHPSVSPGRLRMLPVPFLLAADCNQTRPFLSRTLLMLPTPGGPTSLSPTTAASHVFSLPVASPIL